MTAVILVVEDQPAMQRNIQIGLEMSGYNVVVAADGIEALDTLNSQPIDLILADVAMPRMNGYQLYEKLRQDPRWVPIPFIFISARGLDSDVRYGKALGADDYLVKPFQLEDLLAIVAGRLRRARELAQASLQRGRSASGRSPCGADPCGRRPGIPDSRRPAHQCRAASRVEKWRAGGAFAERIHAPRVSGAAARTGRVVYGVVPGHPRPGTTHCRSRQPALSPDPLPAPPVGLRGRRDGLHRVGARCGLPAGRAGAGKRDPQPSAMLTHTLR